MAKFVVFEDPVMNNTSSEAESACKRQENGDVSAGSDRPLKKARFAWQVKGKYHLKNDITDCESPSTTNAQETEKPSTSANDTEKKSNDLVGNTEQNLEILGDYLLKQDFNTLDSVITDAPPPVKPAQTPSPYPNFTEMLAPPRYEFVYEDVNGNQAVSTVMPPNVSLSWLLTHQRPSLCEDQCIARWQARQMAKGFVDNTINRVLDSWLEVPIAPEPEPDNRVLALDVAEFVNNLPSNNSIENEGILMAISAHGLQNNSSTNSKEDDKQPVTSTGSMTDNITLNGTSLSEDETMDEANQIREESGQIDTTTSDVCFNIENNKISESEDILSEQKLLSDSETSSSENEELKIISNNDTITTSNDDAFTSHFDFMDTAVSFAIQNKGLTSCKTEYG